MAGKYRAYIKQQKKKENGPMLLFYFLCVIGLLFAILITTGKMDALKAKLINQNQQQRAELPKQEEEQPLGPIQEIRVVLLSEDGDCYWNKVRIKTNQQHMEYTKDTWGQSEESIGITAEDGQIFLAEDDDAMGAISYPGVIEVHLTPQGLMVVNQVPLETYLKRVLPSEMPQTYGIEALKAQAVCARSYVYVQARENDYPQVNAQVDDSVAYQVYNKKESNPLSDEAVTQTANQVLMKDGQLVETLYYSTSCGYTMSGEIFGKNASYLASVYVGDVHPEASFEEYIISGDEHAYEHSEKYFRWHVTLDASAYQKEYGRLKSIKCLKRNPGGDIEKLQVKFEKEKKTITGELEIRKFLGKMMQSITYNDGSSETITSDTAILCSSAFVYKKDAQENDILYGGGFGHGAGMSQNGAKALAEQGMTYDGILSFFYKEVMLCDITTLQ